jgi:hypothetical protein
MKFSAHTAHTQIPTAMLVLRLQKTISKKSTSMRQQSERDFFKRVQLRLQEIQRHIQMPKEPLEDVDMERKRPTSPVDTSTGSSPFLETRRHWQSKFHFDMRTLQTALVDNSVSDVDMEGVRPTSPVDTPEAMPEEPLQETNMESYTPAVSSLSHFHMEPLQTALAEMSDSHDCISGAFRNLSVA